MACHGALFTWRKNSGMGNRIREYRKRAGLTLEELGFRVGMSAGHLSRLERGEVSYTQERLETLSRELGCRPADLIDDRPPPSPEAQQMDALMQSLTPDERARLLKMAQAFADVPRSSPLATESINRNNDGNPKKRGGLLAR